MPNQWSTNARNARADSIAAAITAVSLHTGAPGTTGTNEVSGGGYSRQTPTYNSASNGVAELDAPLDFSGPANGDATHVGLWAGGSFYGGRVLTGDQAFNAEGQYQVTALPITAGSSTAPA